MYIRLVGDSTVAQIRVGDAGALVGPGAECKNMAIGAAPKLPRRRSLAEVLKPSRAGCRFSSTTISRARTETRNRPEDDPPENLKRYVAEVRGLARSRCGHVADEEEFNAQGKLGRATASEIRGEKEGPVSIIPIFQQLRGSQNRRGGGEGAVDRPQRAEARTDEPTRPGGGWVAFDAITKDPPSRQDPPPEKGARRRRSWWRMRFAKRAGAGEAP